VAQGSREFIAAVLLLLAAKIAKYLRSIGFPKSGSTVLYGDNKAAINMEAASRSTEHYRHIDIR
jgi:hypothetical protein